jgi:VCBS repeat protein
MTLFRSILVVLIIALLCLCSAPFACALGFNTTAYYAGVAPNSVVTGDFNGDGMLDLIAADSCQNSACDTVGVVTVLLGNGDGTFHGRKKFQAGPFGTSALFVTSGDFNKDGKLDLLVINNGINVFGTVSVLLGNGDGSFQPPVSYSVGGSTPVWAAAGDFNRDGILDLAVSVTTTNSVAILLGIGDGTFQAAVNYPVEGSPQGLAVADLNRDGKLDLAVANECGHDPACRQGTVSILLGKGDGTFGAQTSFFVGIFPLAVGVADFNGDGHRDLVLTLPCGTDGTCVTNGGVGILLGNGDGTFQTVSVYIGLGADTAELGVGDFNGDHHADVVALDYQTADVTVFLGNGDGTLQPGVSFPVGTNPISVAIADFNRDKSVDMAVVSQIPNNISVLLNTGQ